jgi:hypothetical protein
MLAGAAADDKDFHRCEVNPMPEKGLEAPEMRGK